MFRFALYFLFLFLFSFITYAQEKKQEPDNTSLILHLIANYPLTEDLLLKLEKIERECKNLPPELEETDTKSDHIADGDSIENYIAYISSKPKLMSILKENNITPKDFVIAHLTLQATLNVLTTDEENSIYEKNIVPLSNLEFAKKHMYRMIKILKGSC
ncbi:hypothetical protein ABID39_000167 [Bartonella japonica]|uniref:Uncharacterized protein n=1 Tax=Bartonella japonica TaxID=357761 RepID=A0ABV2FLS1_9HYPH